VLKTLSGLLLGLIIGTTLYAQDTTALKNGDQAPSFFLRQLGGGDVFLSRIVGQKVRADQRCPVVLSFFTTGCIPCREEIPFLEALRDSIPGVRFMLINVKEPDELVSAFVRKMNYRLPVLMDRHGLISQRYGVSATPVLVVIDREGRIVWYKKGFSPQDKTDIRTVIVETEATGRHQQVPHRTSP